MILPSILVTDTNIWIDLQNGGLLEEVFHLPYQFIAPDLAMPEFIHPGWEAMQAMGLQFHALGPGVVMDIYHLKQSYQQLSVVDLAALLLAKDIGRQSRHG